MKIIKFTLILFLVFAVNYSFAQKDKKAELKEELKKILREKLRNELNIDESTLDKMLASYDDRNSVIKSLEDEKKQILKSIELDPGNADVEMKIDNIFNIESRIIDQKKNYYTELKKFLTTEQIAKTIVLRKNLYKKLRKEIKEHKRNYQPEVRPDQNK